MILRVAEALSATARPVVLNPVITPSAKKAHTTSPPIRALHPATAFFPTANRHPATSTNIALYQSPTSLTSGSSKTPLCSLTLSRAMSISARTSAA